MSLDVQKHLTSLVMEALLENAGTLIRGAALIEVFDQVDPRVAFVPAVADGDRCGAGGDP